MRKLFLFGAAALLALAAFLAIDIAAAQQATTTLSTSAPLTTETKVGGFASIASEALTWVLTALAVPIGGLIAKVIYQLSKGIGLSITDQDRARLQEMVVNGLHLAARELSKRKGGAPMSPESKQEVIDKTIQYVETQGAETLKALGAPAGSAMATQAITARAEAAIADPNVPIPGTPGGVA